MKNRMLEQDCCLPGYPLGVLVWFSSVLLVMNKMEFFLHEKIAEESQTRRFESCCLR